MVENQTIFPTTDPSSMSITLPEKDNLITTAATTIATIGDNNNSPNRIPQNKDNSLSIVSNSSSQTDNDNNDKWLCTNDNNSKNVYDADVPIMEWGLQLTYAKYPDGLVGPSKSQGIIRNTGNIIVAVEGTSTLDMTFQEQMAMLAGILRKSEEESWDEGSTEKKSIRICFMNGEE
eukprot:15365167-Ditylum_brightwellii.AAC.1